MDKDLTAFEFVLGLLSESEANEVLITSKRNPELAESIAYWQQKITNLDHAVLEQKPPSEVLQNIKSELFLKPKRWDLSLGFKPYAAAFASLLIIVMLGFFMLHNPYKATIGNGWQVKADVEQGKVTLAVLKPDPMPANMVCNLWIKDKDQVMLVGELPMKDDKTMNIKDKQGLYAMFKAKGTLLVTMDKKGEKLQRPVPKRMIYTVAWL